MGGNQGGVLLCFSLACFYIKKHLLASALSCSYFYAVLNFSAWQLLLILPSFLFAAFLEKNLCCNCNTSLACLQPVMLCLLLQHMLFICITAKKNSCS